MQNGEYYDNLMAYSYDDYVEPKENDDLEDYMTDRAVEEHFESLEYESKMAKQMIDDIYAKNVE